MDGASYKPTATFGSGPLVLDILAAIGLIVDEGKTVSMAGQHYPVLYRPVTKLDWGE